MDSIYYHVNSHTGSLVKNVDIGVYFTNTIQTFPRKYMSRGRMENETTSYRMLLLYM